VPTPSTFQPSPTGSTAAPIVYVGANSSTVDDSPGLLSAVQRAVAAGTPLAIRGTLNLLSTCTLGAGEDMALIDLQGATFIDGLTAGTVMINVNGATGVWFEGAATFRPANGHVGIQFLNSVQCGTSAYLVGSPLSGALLGTYLLQVNTGYDVSIVGTEVIDYNCAIKVIDPDDLELSGMRTPNGGATGAATFVLVVSNSAAATYGNANIHDFHLDGGNLANAHPAISAGPNVIGTDLRPINIRIHDGAIVNMNPSSGGTHGDGIDLQADFSKIYGVRVDHAGTGIDVQGVGCVVSGCIATNCYFAGFEVGDPADAWNVTDVTVTGCVGIDNGQGVATAASANFYVSAGYVSSTGYNTQRVAFVGCESYNTQSATKYGLGVLVPPSSTGTISNVSWVGGNLRGQTAAYLETANSGTISSVRIVEADGYNPVGYLSSQPAVVTTAVTDPVPSPVDVLVTVGATATTITKNGTSLGSYTSAKQWVHLEPGESITLSQTTSVTWQWFGE